MSIAFPLHERSEHCVLDESQFNVTVVLIDQRDNSNMEWGVMGLGIKYRCVQADIHFFKVDDGYSQDDFKRTAYFTAYCNLTNSPCC